MSVVVVLGATSGLGEAIARELARQGFDLVVAGRDPAALERIALDLEIRFGIRCLARTHAALDDAGHAGWIADCVEAIGESISGYVVCYGMMPEEQRAASDAAVARELIDLNYRAVVCFLDRAAEDLQSRGAGFLCAVTSVAGDRGRASNAHYGSTKAALSTYLSGLRARLYAQGIRVIDLRPGPVDTRLTYGLEKLPALASPDRVARDAVRGIQRGRAVVYSPPIWRPIMLVIRCLPDFLFRRLRL